MIALVNYKRKGSTHYSKINGHNALVVIFTLASVIKTKWPGHNNDDAVKSVSRRTDHFAVEVGGSKAYNHYGFVFQPEITYNF